MTFVHSLLNQAAATAPEHTAVRDSWGGLTWAELAHAARRAASGLVACGVRPGDRVAVRAVPDRRTVIALYGCLQLGAVVVPFSPDAPRYQLSHVLADASPKLLVTDDESHRAWAPVPVHGLSNLSTESGPLTVVPAHAPGPEDLALLLYTSGSTAQPKGVSCTHAQVAFAARAVAAGVAYHPNDVVYCRLPLSFDYGLYQIFLSALATATLVLADPGEDAALLAGIRRVRATVVPVVPSLATMLLALARREPPGVADRHIRLFTNTGEHLTPRVTEALRRAFPGAGVRLMFGITECKRVTVAGIDEDLGHPGSVGRALPGTTVLILDRDGQRLPPGRTGEICVQGPHVMQGYWQAPDLTAERFRADPLTGERTLFTGDFGHLDVEGRLYFEGRRDDQFKLRGTRVSSLEIERAALTLDGVEAAAVVPPSTERDAVLCVVGSLSPEGVLRGVRGLLGPAKSPQNCRVVTALPLTANGKTDRSRLAGILEGRLL
ncbi:class I adenylate-forming enzyme family protein [Streptomyces sp. CAU 1734]|uniref:class I adenylate-forming enzyme family protein n=1 Tax=Streptomyces sp. CAU 1734 TaxID=3140360 RepID=UPI003260B4EB